MERAIIASMKTTKPHEPTDGSRAVVSTHAIAGTPQKIIAEILDIDPKTLRKHYRVELDAGMHKANAKIASALYTKALSGDTQALIFWAKARMGWSTVQQIDHTSSDQSMTPQSVIVVGGDVPESDDDGESVH